MSNEQRDIIKASDCCHGTFKEVLAKKEGSEEFEGTGDYICNNCNHPCIVVELLVEER